MVSLQYSGGVYIAAQPLVSVHFAEMEFLIVMQCMHDVILLCHIRFL